MEAKLSIANDFVKKLTDEFEQLDRWHSTAQSYKDEFEAVKQLIEDNVKSRSSEKDKRQLLQSINAKSLDYKKKTESLKKIIELMKKKQEIVAMDEAKENAIIDQLERGGMGDIFKETCEYIRQS